MSEINNTCELNFTCLLTDDNNGRIKFICRENGNTFVYSVRDDTSINELKYLLKHNQYMLDVFPEFIEDSLNDIKSYSNSSNVKINREYIIDDDIYSDILKESFVESIEPYFEAFEN